MAKDWDDMTPEEKIERLHREQGALIDWINNVMLTSLASAQKVADLQRQLNDLRNKLP